MIDMSSFDDYEMEDKPMQADKTEYLDCINKVIHGDCLEVMQKIKPNSIDMILTDLPYGNSNQTGLKWDISIDMDQLWKIWNGICKAKCVFCLCATEPFTSIVINSNLSDFSFRWLWKKDKTIGFPQANARPMKCIEDIAVFSKYRASMSANNKLPYYPQGLIEVNKVKKNSEKRLGKVFDESKRVGKDNILRGGSEYIQKYTNYPKEIIEAALDKKLHPTQKPVKLFEYLIKTHSNEGDTILDCCAGSGTTGIACQNTKRNYICIEKEKKYVDVMRERGLSIYGT